MSGRPAKRHIRRRWLKAQAKAHPFCDYCDRKVTYEEATVDLIIPLTMGLGWDLQRNWAYACVSCNHRKDTVIREPLRRRQKVPYCGDPKWDGTPWRPYLPSNGGTP